MTLTDWLNNCQDYFANHDYRSATRASALSFWRGVVDRACRPLPNYGMNVFERDWDVLIILDACRPDQLEIVADEYDFLPANVPTIYSVGSSSKPWMQSTFVPEYRQDVAETAYISGNGFTKDFLPTDVLAGQTATTAGNIPLVADDFAHFEAVAYQDGAHDDTLGTIPPREITARAVEYWRNHRDANRLLLHYMQPHAPYPSLGGVERLASDEVGTYAQRWTVWDRLFVGELSRDAALSAYRDCLRWVLDDIAVLLENIDAEDVVLSADHAELFGEYGMYSHPNVPIPDLRRVPWVEVTATDTETLVPECPPVAIRQLTSGAVSDEQVHSRLADLGYR
ncbi:hypothetical protein EGH21_20540 [Halomicroarcula sp. F13]|uniref:Uncharacterized protein n=1 Tax=Haloarcula rubra TaxID=2487747 RepID=A0AAW4PXM8_9EURY|nr:hypothetical protein [Halomicroarcula rubra]MBX0325419.1 hypothetical protein [Halomicroarcula rubra]